MTDLHTSLLNAEKGSRDLSDAVLLALGWTNNLDDIDPRNHRWLDPSGQRHDYWDDPYARSWGRTAIRVGYVSQYLRVVDDLTS